MSSKIITVWGGKNSGKTTFSINLACALASRERLVGLISSNLMFGEHQIFFGQDVPNHKSLFEALNTENPNIGEKFAVYEENKNLFFLSLPTKYSGLLCETVTLQSVEKMINIASLAFDVLIIDGSPEVSNPISGVGLWLADTIFTLHKPSVAALMWYQGMSGFAHEMNIKDKQLHILQAANGEFDDKTYREMSEFSVCFELPYVKRAGELQNAGTPMYFFHDRSCKRYNRVFEKITDKICGGENP